MARTVEERLAALEAKVETMEARRAKILPPELLDDENIQQLASDAAKAMVARWRLSRAENGVSMAQARLLEAKDKLEDRQRLADAKLAAEIAAVIAFYEEHGMAPEGYEIIG